ncbi:hypothetical protein [Bradyrhizobium sp.]|nr:hypothetical protein [Bradyrhizobium sp.]
MRGWIKFGGGKKHAEFRGLAPPLRDLAIQTAIAIVIIGQQLGLPV